MEEELEAMPHLVLTLHVSCCGLEEKVWRDIQICNDATLQDFARTMLASLDIEDLSDYTIISAGEKFTERSRNGNEIYNSREYTMADLYMDKGDYFILECGCLEYCVSITNAVVPQDETVPEHPRIIASAGGGIAEIDHLIACALQDEYPELVMQEKL